MRLLTYLRRSSDGGFEVRIVVPADVRPIVGRTNLTRRLGRLTKSEANRIAGPVVARFLADIQSARSGGAAMHSMPVPAVTLERAPACVRPAPSSRLMALFDGYVREREPSAATIKRWGPVITSLIGHLGHDEARSVTPEDLISWKEALSGQGVSGRTIREVYLAAAKVILAWAVENRRIRANPAAGLTVRVPKRCRSRGPSFTPAEARIILRASLSDAHGRVSHEHALARRWVPWMSAYSGARVGEITQMRGCDILRIEGVWAMRITPDAGSTKNREFRLVPIHGHLIEQGLLAMAAGAGESPMFFDPRRGRGGSAGNAHHKKVGERLARWVRDLGVDDPQVQPNHGWRHLFKTLARRAGIDPEIRDAIQGHAPRSVAEAYGEWPIDVLAVAVERIPRFSLHELHEEQAESPR